MASKRAPKKKKPPKKRAAPSSDPNVAAFDVVRRLTDRAVVVGRIDAPSGGKNPAAVALGHLGGLKGGAARKRALSPERRSEIAKAAAKKRWGNGDR